jgi:hypothetical protein
MAPFSAVSTDILAMLRNGDGFNFPLTCGTSCCTTLYASDEVFSSDLFSGDSLWRLAVNGERVVQIKLDPIRANGLRVDYVGSNTSYGVVHTVLSLESWHRAGFGTVYRDV